MAIRYIGNAVLLALSRCACSGDYPAVRIVSYSQRRHCHPAAPFRLLHGSASGMMMVKPVVVACLSRSIIRRGQCGAYSLLWQNVGQGYMLYAAAEEDLKELVEWYYSHYNTKA
jgi:hypothetical protein